MQETQETWVPGSGKSPGGWNGYPLQCSMDRGAQWATVHGIRKSQTWLSDWACTVLWYLGACWPRRDELIPEITNSSLENMPFMCKVTHPKPYPEPTTPNHALYPAHSTPILWVLQGYEFYYTSHILPFFFFKQMEGLWQTCIEKVCWCHFPNSYFFKKRLLFFFNITLLYALIDYTVYSYTV